MESNIAEHCHRLWAKIFEKVRKSVVFIDNESAESLHWVGGASRMFEAGATDIKQMSSFEVSLLHHISCEELNSIQ